MGPYRQQLLAERFDDYPPLDGSRFDETKFPKMMAIHDKVLALCARRTTSST
jgi:hypothetical protein